MDPDRLDALLADAVAAEAGRYRVAERHLRQAAEEGATFIGTMVDLMERSETVSVRMGSGRSHRGQVVAVGRDFVVVRDDDKPPAVVVVRAIASVRTTPAGGPHPDTTGDRRPPLDASFGAVLAGAGAERPTVQVGIEGESGLLLGQLRAVGHDVVTIRLEAESNPTVYLPLAAVTDVVLLER